MRLVTSLLILAALAVASGCGDDDTTGGPRPQAESRNGAAPTDSAGAPHAERPGTRLTILDSDFGAMLFDSRRQAIYVFENDRKNKTVCYGECAEAWPPVVTKAEPVAGNGVDPALVGTIERRDGTRQVTYAGRPLYYYAHEGPGEVRCHNVDLNGGFWWVVGPDGMRRAQAASATSSPRFVRPAPGTLWERAGLAPRDEEDSIR